MTGDRILLFAFCALALSACATRQEAVQDRENLLVAAGFDVRPASTPERRSQMAALPADRVVQQTRDGRLVYLYADPLVCDCVYMGGQEAWSRYQQERLQLRIADEQLDAAQIDENAFYGGPWGGFYGPGFY